MRILYALILSRMITVRSCMQYNKDHNRCVDCRGSQRNAQHICKEWWRVTPLENRCFRNRQRRSAPAAPTVCIRASDAPPFYYSEWITPASPKYLMGASRPRSLKNRFQPMKWLCCKVRASEYSWSCFGLFPTDFAMLSDNRASSPRSPRLSSRFGGSGCRMLLCFV
jgi:hypothetical protein